MPNYPSSPPDFETSLSELERIVATMESGQMPLDEALAAYQRGVTLLRQCQQTLNQAETQIQILEQEGLREFAAPAPGKDTES